MDHKSHNVTKNIFYRHQDVLPAEKKKRRRGPIHVVRVALYMLKLKSGSKSHQAQTDITVASKWKKFVSSIRPLHIQISTQSSAPQYPIVANPAPLTSTYELPPVDGVEELEVFTPLRSPEEKSSSASSLSSSGQTSDYASALNLQELDGRGDDESDEEDSYYDDKYGDEMIDVKAEQFIAKFYAQMKGQ